jgi:hypothetical protein
MKSNMAQRLLLFLNNKHKKCEMQKPIGKGKYGCRYCNEAPKFQLVKVTTDVGIATKPQNSSW